MQAGTLASKRTSLDDAFELYLARLRIERRDLTDRKIELIRSLLAKQLERFDSTPEDAAGAVIVQTTTAAANY